MDREEAIKELNAWAMRGYAVPVVAIHMAIEALQVKTDGDLISRQDAIKVIDYRRKTANIDSRIVLDEVEDRIRELPSADPKWIPASERLPDNPKDVLTTLSNGMVCIGRHHSFSKWTFEAASIMVAFPEEAVIAWMPLPEPYREDGEEE